MRTQTFGKVPLGHGAKLLSGSSRLFLQDIEEVAGVREQEVQEEKRDDEEGGEVNGEIEEITHRAHET